MQVAMRVRFDWMTRTVAAISLTWMAIAFLFLSLHGQEPPSANSAAQASPVVDSGPIAVVPLNSKNPDAAAKVTGALEVTQGKAIIVASGTVTSGSETTDVILPHRGVLRVCASTTIKLAADSGVAAGEVPGLLMALDHGAIEASFATGRDSDTVLTPDFRILIGGPGAADVKVRLGDHGDTCVDNAGENAPYVLVSSVFDGGAYRVQAGQRVMFQHGNLHEVVDNEKESCGCPPTRNGPNEFPLAQSEGLAPQSPPVSNPAVQAGLSPQATETLTYNAPASTAKPGEATPAPVATPAATAGGSPLAPAVTPPAEEKKQGVFARLGRFFRKIFGAE